VVNTGAHTIECTNAGIGTYHNDGRRYLGDRALGQAEIDGSNTGSGYSYTVGMLRPADVLQGRIPHAIRVATGYINASFIWPATRSDQSTAANEAPMGSRVFLPAGHDLTPYNTAIDAYVEGSLMTDLGRAFCKMVVRAIQEFGMALSDGGGGAAHNIYCEGDATADWATYIGPINEGAGTWNFLGRCIRDAFNADSNAGWNAMQVADAVVFDSYGAS
jgi:hypothetical protein